MTETPSDEDKREEQSASDPRAPDPVEEQHPDRESVVSDEPRADEDERPDQTAVTPDEPSRNADKLLNRLEEKLDRLTGIFEEEISKDQSRTEYIKSLQKEVVRYRDQLVFENMLRRHFLDLISLFDSISAVESHNRSNEPSAIDTIQNLESFRRELEQILKNQEVTVIEANSDDFDPELQEAFSTVDVDDPDQDLKVAEVLKRGFLYRERTVLRPELVTVKKYKGD